MGKVFEDYFSELQADMVSICLEYVNDKADYVFIDCSNEDGAISSNFFFCINGKMEFEDWCFDGYGQSAVIVIPDNVFADF